MINLKDDRKDTSPKKNFIYKHLDNEYTVECKNEFDIRYNGVTGEVEFKSTTPYSVWTSNHTFAVIIGGSSEYVNNAFIFQMFKVNSIKMNVYSTYDPSMYTVPYSFGHITYGVRFYPSRASWIGNPFKILKDPRSMIVSTKKPLTFQEIIFPKQYVILNDSQGFGRWISTDFNLIYQGMEASIQMGCQYNGSWPQNIPLGHMTASINCSFRLLKA